MQIEMIERRARKTDPHTSHASAARSARFSSSHAGRILALFQAAPEYTWTADEIANVTGLTVVQICRRLPEMAEIEVVRVAGQDLERDGFRVWRLRESCFFHEAGRLAREGARA